MKKIFGEDLEKRLGKPCNEDVLDESEVGSVEVSKGPVYVAYRQNWEESERGWGVRPDGCSLHETLCDALAYRREYWAGMPKGVPEEYERESGRPYLVEVPKELHDKVLESDNGIRMYQHTCREWDI